MGAAETGLWRGRSCVLSAFATLHTRCGGTGSEGATCWCWCSTTSVTSSHPSVWGSQADVVLGALKGCLFVFLPVPCLILRLIDSMGGLMILLSFALQTGRPIFPVWRQAVMDKPLYLSAPSFSFILHRISPYKHI